MAVTATALSSTLTPNVNRAPSAANRSPPNAGPSQADESEREWVAGDLINEPAHDHRLHLRRHGHGE